MYRGAVLVPGTNIGHGHGEYQYQNKCFKYEGQYANGIKHEKESCSCQTDLVRHRLLCRWTTIHIDGGISYLNHCTFINSLTIFRDMVCFLKDDGDMYDCHFSPVILCFGTCGCSLPVSPTMKLTTTWRTLGFERIYVLRVL